MILLIEKLEVSRPSHMDALLESHMKHLVDAFGFEEDVFEDQL